MNQKQLAYFLAVYDAGSIQAAADRLYITRQGVSRALRQLEDELAQPLFTRTTNGIAPTDFAQAILPHVRQLLNEYDYIAGTQTLAAQQHSVVTVYALDHIAGWLGAAFFCAFAAEHPDITPSFIESTDCGATEALARGRGDFAITTEPFDTTRFVAKKLFRTPFCLRMHKNHPLATKAVITVEDLDGAAVAGKGRAYQCFQEKIDRHFLAAHIDIRILLETSDETLLASLAAANKAVILEHGYTAALVSPPDTIVRPFTIGGEDGADIFLLQRRDQLPTQSARLFQTFLVRHISMHPKDLQESCFQTNPATL
ncbi:LysR family transcriptional regulator [uncultured Selenomonas sp.]|uniref:LysR family transcriptional regulator n=1 Tax=uncultured Selenomonas sp. TaxID=159275 RepID=UPI0025DAC74B|nr:LysR family transcriptional regulator [uncultured Selenomonas sp.]